MYSELHKLTLPRRDYRNIANIPLAMQTVEVVWPYTSNRLLPTKVGVTRALGGSANELNVHAGTTVESGY